MFRINPIPRQTIIDNLRKNIENRIPIVGAGAGVGISAKAEEMGGADLIICYNTGFYRMHGRPSNAGTLPLGDANSILLDLAGQVLPIVKNTPVIAGVMANDPFRDTVMFLKQVKELGFSGVQNFPTIASHVGRTRALYEANGFTYDNEVEMIKAARDMDLFTTPYVWDEEQAAKMTEAGADLLVIHAAMTVGGTTGAPKDIVMNMEQACDYIVRMRDTITSIRPDAMIIVHGGPIAYPKDLEYVMNKIPGLHGFYGASSCERLPVEEAISKRISEFKSVKF